MKCLIDGDILTYRCGFAAESSNYRIYVEGEEDYGWVASFKYKKEAKAWINGQEDLIIEKEKEVEPLENALHNIKHSINSILRTTRSDDYIVYLSGSGNFREDIATIQGYKANRDPDNKPHWYKEIRAYLVNNFGAVVVEGEEADDAMGIAQCEAHIGALSEHFGVRKYLFTDLYSVGMSPTCICTIDKDLNCIPGWHYNWVKDEMYWVDEVEGLRNFYKQMLQGDATDNIPGLYRIANKRCTKKILAGLDEINTEKDMWLYVLNQYLEHLNKDSLGFVYNRAYFIDKLTEIGRLLWIRREPNQMWEFPT